VEIFLKGSMFLPAILNRVWRIEFNYSFIYLFLVLGIEPRVLHMLGKIVLPLRYMQVQTTVILKYLKLSPFIAFKKKTNPFFLWCQMFSCTFCCIRSSTVGAALFFEQNAMGKKGAWEEFWVPGPWAAPLIPPFRLLYIRLFTKYRAFYFLHLLQIG
jgi:hypothetical protein